VNIEEKKGPSPILILGIIVFILPFFNQVIKMNIPVWISGIGIVLIVIGSLLSIGRN